MVVTRQTYLEARARQKNPPEGYRRMNEWEYDQHRVTEYRRYLFAAILGVLTAALAAGAFVVGLVQILR